MALPPNKAKALFNDKELTERPERLVRFIELYLEYKGDHKKAWVDAGYSESGLPRAMKTLRDNFSMVNKLVYQRIGNHVPLALEGIVELAVNAKQESIRLKACQDILSRAGYDAAMKLETTVTETKDMKDEELTKELKELLGKSNTAAALVAKDLH